MKELPRDIYANEQSKRVAHFDVPSSLLLIVFCRDACPVDHLLAKLPVSYPYDVRGGSVVEREMEVPCHP